jgi:hypothetical protein
MDFLQKEIRGWAMAETRVYQSNPQIEAQENANLLVFCGESGNMVTTKTSAGGGRLWKKQR